ncbi:Ribosome hibernation promotion factor [Acaryochloris thomasi RCC1774]|uniref:Ribosome hibernation promoting factor n=1 Tax=Acaryochloris thomasi RCC1774 TaxID=1764569 RepID=A0A2W1K1D4_9CYAN|nr:ribosome-associated translation inhibitor RaiA [Acaryochloris thomasi]PZD74321.1 Ribosome hibernation promotion factor [Acaryochloris thomasi RCC1774]
MKLVIHGKNIEITDAIREHVNQKIGKAASHYQHLTTEIDVHLSVSPSSKGQSKQTAEVTLFVSGSVIRAEESSENLYASIDLVASKIARQLRKYKEKRQDKSHHRDKEELLTAEQPLIGDLTDRVPELPADVVRSKYFAMPPMAVNDALEQLDLVDHDFYVFCNAETGQINVIYERNHGGYGVIQPRNQNGQKNSSQATASKVSA